MLYLKKAFGILFFLLIISCAKQKKIATSYYSIVDSIKVAEPSMIYPIKKTDLGLMGVNLNKTRLELYDEKGKVIAFFGKKGKGPKEFLQPSFFDVLGNKIVIFDKRKKTIVFLELKDNQFQFISEHVVKLNIMNILYVNENRILVSAWGTDSDMYLFDDKGNILSEHKISKESGDINSENDMWAKVVFVQKIKNTIIAASLMNFSLTYYKIDENDELIEVKKIKNIIDKESYVDKKTKQFIGIAECFSLNNSIFVGFHPELTSNEIMFYEYSEKGDFLGTSKLKNYQTESLCSFSITSNGEYIYFLDLVNNDEIIYIARKNK